ncbi:protein-L-isoaspartate O-methyltransferase [Methanococcus vannielii SB]|uniref:Protein-L-isoaspartate O-methyltransferase n=1 Tax=Methanococcus vannielii (strain ATCC 35089 / DSM 1224 / JCM 13029 / OCM 148 / SB) TaxID=406327 RepID=PIMT_METVS|nr:protein-L-isoaspartate O-methyltransferase [Methanococcus vannielii]A6UR90.1 RecName: Full=Protein-L-isoaspartate O-methyltransferase; AltName: Full=L-isoaspartyl protein carboxyl methyltransferase; AltName: Full=Protein L-isoaspartyl methyltransferase; AltName: Full=Protein-beta-aspartate methyltransferase; Short=PIMT [Methanococcus vannielii SB]ABR55012.1 protein-L-isoaspartate O-methyltransferase [Methanococcus vannielii SB]
MPLNEMVSVVTNLVERGYIRKKSVVSALLSVPRHKFVPKYLESSAYQDNPLEIGYGQTISAIHMVGIMCEELDLDKGQNVLEIGTGSGYHAAVVLEIIGKSGKLTTIERVFELFNSAKENLLKFGYNNIEVIYGDGTKGHIENAPYDRIYLTAAGKKVPEILFEQLNDGGILLAPVGTYNQYLIKYMKINGQIYEEILLEVSFVPLIEE